MWHLRGVATYMLQCLYTQLIHVFWPSIWELLWSHWPKLKDLAPPSVFWFLGAWKQDVTENKVCFLCTIDYLLLHSSWWCSFLNSIFWDFDLCSVLWCGRMFRPMCSPSVWRNAKLRIFETFFLCFTDSLQGYWVWSFCNSWNIWKNACEFLHSGMYNFVVVPIMVCVKIQKCTV